MNSVGERLRLERLRQGREISDIAAQTRISSRYIEAIETGDLRSLPGGFFYRSFVRQYASVLGIDEAEVDQELEAVLGPPEEIYAPAPRSSEPIDVPPMPAASRSEATRQIPVSLVFLVLVIIAASLLYSLWQRSRRSPEPVPESVASQPVQPPPVAAAPVPAPPQPQPAGSNEPLASSRPVAPPVVNATPPQPVATPAGAIGTVQVVATGEVWIRLSSGGKNLVERTLQPGESRNVALTEPGIMRVGDAANLQVWWNGRQLGPLGPAGQLRDVSFSAGGAKVSLPPRPDAAENDETNPIAAPGAGVPVGKSPAVSAPPDRTAPPR